MTERAFVSVSRTGGKQRAHIVLFQNVISLCAVPFGQDADIADRQLAGIGAPRINHQPMLGAMKGHRLRGMHRVAKHLSRRAVHAGRDIHRNDRQAALVHPLNGIECGALQLAAQSRSIQRIDNRRAVRGNLGRFII